MGHVPRSMSVHCQGELTWLACPGDVVTIDGIFLPSRVAKGGYRAMKAGLVAMSYCDYSTSSRSTRIELKLVEAMVLRKGFTDVQLKHCLEEYQSLDIIQMNTTGTHLDLLSGE
jgi:DNA replicative helicase MCM subunit Mcm2 (Cdc46/Mcm family)